MNTYDPINSAIFMSSYAANLLVQELPEVDICMDLKSVLQVQLAIVNGALHGDKFNIYNLEDFSDRCEKIIKDFEEDEGE